ncbi:hypothetical protein V8C44DRAFT_336838 [Trichoderma aethiopicum]
MRYHNSPNGKVYRFKPYHEWDDWTQRHCHVPKIVRNHMVVVVGSSPVNGNWLVVTVQMALLLLQGENDLFVPVAPMRKDPVTHMQLHLAHDPYGSMGLPHRSYLRVERIHSVPPEALVEQRSYHRES